MTDSGQSDMRSAFVMVKPDAELAIEIGRPNELVLTVGVPSGWISEEPAHAIVLNHNEARRVAAALSAAANIAP